MMVTHLMDINGEVVQGVFELGDPIRVRLTIPVFSPRVATSPAVPRCDN